MTLGLRMRPGLPLQFGVNGLGEACGTEVPLKLGVWLELGMPPLGLGLRFALELMLLLWLKMLLRLGLQQGSGLGLGLKLS